VFPGRQLENIDPSVIEKIAVGQWMGQANRLSDEVVPWEAITKVSEATLKPKTDIVARKYNSAGLARPDNSQVSARQIIRQRRSAAEYDGKTHISDTAFYRILSFATNRSTIPWDIYPWPAQIHLCLFVHRVEGIVPGIYFLVRDPDRLIFLKSTMKQEFVWRKPETCPTDLNLYLLQEGNFQRLSTQVSCTQEIAGQGAFSLGMISDFASSLEKYGAWFYRNLFWESGMIGQALYLAAEEAGVRGTGIGCYFDDAVHGILGISDAKLQSLYHFTIGRPVEDTRLTTLRAYPWSR
jgi:nitroreductase